MSDTLLERLTFEPDQVELSPIPWPDGLAPSALMPVRSGDAPLPRADVLVVTWTSAEWMALGDVLAPRYQKAQWPKYTKNWAEFEPHLTWRSPAKEAHCLGEYMLTKIGSKRVLLFHSQLHLATDDNTAPVIALWEQIVQEVKPDLIITTGTAGGIGALEVLGDVAVCAGAKFNCTKVFKGEPWAQQHFGSIALDGKIANGTNFRDVEKLIAINAARLPQDLTPRSPQTWCGGDVETVDYFAFADTDDSYGVVANDPQAQTEEMDDATLPLALANIGSSAKWLSIRNASDPQVPSSIGDLKAQKKWAGHIYEKWGYTTTLGSAITCWAVIADL